ncbi:hypothetical protein, partial [Jeotgalibacillus sp. ET6]
MYHDWTLLLYFQSEEAIVRSNLWLRTADRVKIVMGE